MDEQGGDLRAGSSKGQHAGEDTGAARAHHTGKGRGTADTSSTVDQRRSALEGQRRRVVELRAEVARARQADQAELRRGSEVPPPRPAGVNARLPSPLRQRSFWMCGSSVARR